MDLVLMMQVTSWEMKGNLLQEQEIKRDLENNIFMYERLLLSHNQEKPMNT